MFSHTNTAGYLNLTAGDSPSWGSLKLSFIFIHNSKCLWVWCLSKVILRGCGIRTDFNATPQPTPPLSDEGLGGHSPLCLLKWKYDMSDILTRSAYRIKAVFVFCHIAWLIRLPYICFTERVILICRRISKQEASFGVFIREDIKVKENRL